MGKIGRSTRLTCCHPSSPARNTTRSLRWPGHSQASAWHSRVARVSEDKVCLCLWESQSAESWVCLRHAGQGLALRSHLATKFNGLRHCLELELERANEVANC